MSFQGKSIYWMRMGAGLMLTMGLGLAPDAKAQPSSINFRTQLESIWSRIVKDDEYREPPQTSRGELCAIAPSVAGAEPSTIWHSQPVIALQPGSIAQVSLRIDGSEDAFWDYVPAADENHVVYDGEPLVSGQTYVMGLHAIANDDPTLTAEFQILPAATRTLIENGLMIATMDDDPIFENVSDSEKQAIQQANYFANRGLPYDAIQAMFSISDPSADLLGRQEQILTETCQPSLTD